MDDPHCSDDLRPGPRPVDGSSSRAGGRAERSLPIHWIGDGPPPADPTALVEGLRVTRHGAGEPVALDRPSVLCFAPGATWACIRAWLAAASVPVAAVALSPEAEIDELQELIDDDRLFYLATESLADRDLAELLAAAAASLGPRRPSSRPVAGAAAMPLDRLLSADALRRLATARSPAERAAELETIIRRVTGAAAARAVLLDRELAALWLPTAAEGDAHSPAVGLVAWALRTGSSLCLPAAGDDARYDDDLDAAGGTADDRLLAVPVVGGDGDAVAVLVARRGAGEPPFGPREVAALETVAAHVVPYLAAEAAGGTDAARPAPAPSTDATDRPEGPFRRRALDELQRPTGAGARPLLAAIARRRRRIRYVPQAALADCGAACLAMTLDWHGKQVSLDDVRRITGSGSQGLDAAILLRAGEHFGLRGRGVEVREPGELALLEPGTILHWGFNHFVVFERLERRGAWVLDPGHGRRLVPHAELDRSLTGVALTFEPGAEFTTGGERRSLLGRYLRRVVRHRATLARVFGASGLLQLSTLALPLLTGLVVDRVIPEADLQLFWLLAAGAAAFAGFNLLVNLLRARTLLALRTRLDAQLSADFLEHLVRLPFAFFQQRSAGDLLMRLGSNATIREILTSAVLSGALDGLMVVSYLAILLVADWRLGLLVAVLAVVRVAILVAALSRRRRLTSEMLEAQAASRGYQVQLLAGIEALKATGAERRAVDTWSHLFTRELNTSLARGRLDALVNSLLDGLALASPLAVLLYGATRVIGGDLTLGTMLGLAALAAGFLAPLSTLVSNGAQFQLLGSYLERLEDVFSTPAEPDGFEHPRPESFAGRVTLEEVTFRYGPLVPPALEAASLDIAPGELVAVVGASGSGKSTLAGVVAGLLAPESGRVLYDGRPLEELPREWLRERLAYVPQQSYLFGTTIRANIALQDPELPIERVVEAAKLAAVHDEIEALPMGYDSVLADAGSSLSGGQRQRIALARALVGRPEVLILDEATSALDAVTEVAVQESLERLRVTRIVAAHRLSTIRRADRIVVLERGRIVQTGTHEELAARPGPYRRLVEAQLDPAADRRHARGDSAREASR